MFGINWWAQHEWVWGDRRGRCPSLVWVEMLWYARWTGFGRPDFGGFFGAQNRNNNMYEGFASGPFAAYEKSNWLNRISVNFYMFIEFRPPISRSKPLSKLELGTMRFWRNSIMMLLFYQWTWLGHFRRFWLVDWWYILTMGNFGITPYKGEHVLQIWINHH